MKGFDYSVEIKDSKTYETLRPVGKKLADMLYGEMTGGNRRYAANFAVALGIMGDRRAAGVLAEVMRNPGGEFDPLVDFAYPNRLKALCLAGRIDIPGAAEILLKVLDDAGKSYTETLTKAKACDYSRYPGWVYPFSGALNAYREAAVSLSAVSLSKMLSRKPDDRVRRRLEEWIARKDSPIPRMKEIRTFINGLVSKS